MKDYRNSARFAAIAVKSSIRGVVFWLIFGIMFLILVYLCGDLGSYLQDTNDQLNIFEFYIWFNGVRQSRVMYIVGVLFLVCGMDFFHRGSSYYLLRMNKKTWIISQVIYLLVIVILFNLLILAAFWFSSKGCLTLEGIWSDSSFIACQFGMEEIGVSTVFFANPYFLRYNPNMLGIVTFCLQILIGVIMGLVLILFQIQNRTAVGVIIILGFWFAELYWLPMFDSQILLYMTPFRMSDVSSIGFGGAGPSVIYAFSYLIIMMIVLESVLVKQAASVDFLKME